MYGSSCGSKVMQYSCAHRGEPGNEAIEIYPMKKSTLGKQLASLEGCGQFGIKASVHKHSTGSSHYQGVLKCPNIRVS